MSIKKIGEAYKNDKPFVMKLLLEKYMQEDIKWGIDRSWLLKYITSLYRTGEHQKAVTLLDLLWNNFITKEYEMQYQENLEPEAKANWCLDWAHTIIIHYAYASCEERVRSLLNYIELASKDTENSKFYYSLARHCSLNGLYQLAIELYEKCIIKDSKKEYSIRANKMIERLKLALESKDFSSIRQSYGYFLSKQQRITRGQLITLKTTKQFGYSEQAVVDEILSNGDMVVILIEIVGDRIINLDFNNGTKRTINNDSILYINGQISQDELTILNEQLSNTSNRKR